MGSRIKYTYFYYYVYFMVDCICMCLLELQGTQSKNYNLFENETFLPTMGFDLLVVPSAYEADTLTIAPRDLVSTIG